MSRNPVNGHGRNAAPDGKSHHARFPLPNPLDETTSRSTKLPKTAAKSPVIPQAGEGANESLREFQVKEIGWGEVTVADNVIARNWFGDIKNFQAFHWHGETFTLPQGATLLLSSAYCANQAYAIGKHLAMQCHVEMTAEMIASWCVAGADEVDSSKGSPAVQSVEEMQRQMKASLPGLNSVAARLYSHWIKSIPI